MPLKKLVRLFRRVGTTLRILKPITIIEHASGDLTIQAMATGKDLVLKGHTSVDTYVNTNYVLRVMAGLLAIRSSQVRSVQNGSYDLGAPTYQWKQSFLKSSYQTPLLFEITLNTDFTGGSQAIALPHTVPTVKYQVKLVATDCATALCKILTDTLAVDQFNVTGYAGDNSKVDTDAVNTQVWFELSFYP